jgi:hypothetical protein
MRDEIGRATEVFKSKDKRKGRAEQQEHGYAKEQLRAQHANSPIPPDGQKDSNPAGLDGLKGGPG